MQEIVGGRYRLEERVGVGGMADVWRAVDRRTGATVAVKRVHPSLVADPAARARFERELTAARAVVHPRLVRVLDAHVADDDAWLVMEYVDGGTLAAWLRRGPIEEAAVASIGADVAEGLAALHAAGIVHRDVTPANILLDGSLRARLSDLGIARAGDDGRTVTATGDLVGTFRFMAPEQLAGGDATPASDAWALGAVLYEALAGRPPFDVSSPAALLESQRMPAQPLETRDAAIGALAARLLDRNPDGRPAIAEVAERLRAAAPLGDPADDRTMVIGGGLPGTTAGRGQVAGPDAGADPGSDADAVPALPALRPSASPRGPVTARPRPRQRRGMAAAGLLALALLVGLVAATGAGRPVDPAAGDGTATPRTTATPARTESPTARPASTRPPTAPDGGDGGNGGKDKPGKQDKPGKGHGKGRG